MKKTALLTLMVGLMFQVYTLRAEESPRSSASATTEPVVSDSAAPAEPTTPTASSATPEATPAPVTAAVGLPAAAPAATATTPSAAVAPATSENLEFMSGEITSTDAAAKTMTVKLYGETENAANDKMLTVKLDETTDITDGEKDRDIKSLTNGTEVDVEYDPATNKATYIFVY